jgi:hypothetical protein
MEALGWRRRWGSSPAARRGARQRAGLTHASASNTLSCQRETSRSKNPIDRNHGIYRERRNVEPIHALGRPASEKRQGTKSRWVGHWRCRGLYGELSGASGSKRMTRSGRTHGFGPRRGCPCGAERADRGFVDRNGAGDAGQSDGPTQAGAMPVEIRREWLVSLRWRIGGDGIMRCRS